MLLIACPWCGPRGEIEFHCGGPSHVTRPQQDCSDEDWARYLHTRANPKGVHLERWRHTHGCRQWFNVARDTTSHRILAIYKMGEKTPDSLSGAVS